MVAQVYAIHAVKHNLKSVLGGLETFDDEHVIAPGLEDPNRVDSFDSRVVDSRERLRFLSGPLMLL